MSADPTTDPGGATDAVAFSLGGHPLVHVLDGSASDLHAIAGRLGLDARPLAQVPGATDSADDVADPPLLTIRYVTRLPIGRELRTVGKDDGAFDGQWFAVRRGGRPVAVIPLQDVGQPQAEILAVRGSGVPGRLVSLLNLAMLGRPDRIALHASAVDLDGLGIAACGWSGSGKTEAMLGLMDQGARFVGDEWTYRIDGRLVGLPERVRIQDWHAQQLAWLQTRVGRGQAVRMGAAAAAERSGRWLGRTAPGVPVVRSLAGAARRFGTLRHVDLPAADLFEPARRASSVGLDRLVLLETSTATGIRVEPIDPIVVAARLALAHVHHRRELLGWYWQSRFAYTERRNALLDDIETVERTRLETVFEGQPAIRVEHAHDVDIRALGRAIAQACR
jgi:hypothetical protein